MSFIEVLSHNSNYVFCFVIFAIGFYLTATSSSSMKKLFGCLIFQASILLFFINIGYVDDSRSPILIKQKDVIYANPLPQVLVLTAIVVGLATLSVGIAIVIRIKKVFG